MADRSGEHRFNQAASSKVVQVVSSHPRGGVPAFDIPAAISHAVLSKLPRAFQKSFVDSHSLHPNDSQLKLVHSHESGIRIRTRNISCVLDAIRSAGGSVDCSLLPTVWSLHRPPSGTHPPDPCRVQTWSTQNGQIVEDKRFRLAAIEVIATIEPWRMLFVCETEAHLQQTARSLENVLSESVDRLRSTCPVQKHRVAVGTIPAAISAEWGYHQIVFPWWTPGMINTARALIWDRVARSVLVIRTPDDKLSDWDIRQLEAYVGGVIKDQSAAGRLKLEFSFVRFGGPHLAATKTEQCGLLGSIEKHRARNRLLAALAAEIPKHRPEPDGRVLNTLLTATTLQAQKLQGLLPHWRLIVGGQPHDLFNESIVTLEAASELHRAGRFKPHRLIVGLGGEPSPWLCQFLKEQKAAGGSLQIIDLTDEFGHQPAALSAARRRAYENVGCHWRPLPKDALSRAWKAAKRLGPLTSQTRAS